MRVIRSFLLLALVVSAPRLHAQRAEADADVRAVAQLEVQRYQILREHLDGTLDDAAREALADLSQRRREIDERYRREIGAGLTWVQFDNLVRSQVGSQAGPSWNALMLERFPQPERIRQDYSDDVRYAAALSVVGYEFALGRTIRPPITPMLSQRDALYADALTAVEAPYRAQGEESVQWLRFQRDVLKLSQSAAFKREVLGRYVPLFASFVRDDAPEMGTGLSAYQQWLAAPLWGDEFEPGPRRFLLVMAVSLFALLLTPLWIVWQARRAGRKHRPRQSAEPVRTGLGLPPELQHPEFPAGLQLELGMQTGHVLDVQVWSETTVSWQSRSAGPGAAPTVSVQTHVTPKERVWVETMDGRQHSWTFSRRVFEAMPGQAISWIQYVRRGGELEPILFYNHGSDRYHETDWWPTVHGHALGSWFCVTVFWVTPWALNAFWFAVPEGLLPIPPIPVVITLAAASFVLTLVARFWIHGRRRRRWKQHHRPRLLEMLERFSRSLRRSTEATDQPVA